MQDKTQEKLEQEALDLSSAEVNDLKKGGATIDIGDDSDDVQGIQLGAFSAINRYEKNLRTK